MSSFSGIVQEFIWNTKHSQQQGLIASYHEYILVYTKPASNEYPNFNSKGGNIIAGAMKKISKKNGASDFTFPAGVRCEVNHEIEFKDMWGDVETVEIVNGEFRVKDKKTVQEMTLRAGWTQKKQMEDYFYSNKTVYDTKGQVVKEFFFNSTGKLKCLKERSKITPNSILDQFGTVSQATQELSDIIGKNKFNQPKPYLLIKYLLEFCTEDEDIVLDSFAGSGSTGHAVLSYNYDGEKKLKFIIIELEDYAESITAERVKRVIKGYGEGSKAVEGTGGSFDYYELGISLFKEDKNLNEEVGVDKIREYIYYTETRQNLTKTKSDKAKYLLDTYNGTGYYFYYEKDELTCLDYNTLSIVKEQAEQYIIYADLCLLDKEYMLEKNIIFKKIPRDIKRF
ncbi:MAG: hypothetical protein JXR90_00795 [Spirochaetes bacterium]|nr:hypothetical protein [Spirochaetota bacterium]